MTWIKTVLFAEADETLRHLMAEQRSIYPVEYSTPVFPRGMVHQQSWLRTV